VIRIGVPENRDPGHRAKFAEEGLREIVEHLAVRSIHARDGHMYAPRVIEAAGLDPATGVARISLCHYNSLGEIERLGEALRSLPA